jgi:AraC-like DNA-binding protein
MKTLNPVKKISFNNLLTLFIKNTEHSFVLDAIEGNGYVRQFELEKGLQVRLWNCRFINEIELYSDVTGEANNKYFTLAFFPDSKGLLFAPSITPLQENKIWNTIFMSDVSDYKIYISAMVSVQCVSISLSAKWLDNNIFNDNETFISLKGNVFSPESFSLIDSMNSSQKILIEELLNELWRTALGTFYIKTSVLNLVSDFFYKLKEKKFPRYPISGIPVTEIEKDLRNNLLEPLPDLRKMADLFFMSESTMKRHFKKQYGMNMSTYFMREKMKYAQQLMNEKNLSLIEAARILGYKNVNSFIAMYKKHYGELNTTTV